VNRRIVKLGLVIVLSLLALPMLLGLECYTSDVFKTCGDVLTSPAVGPDGSVYVCSADGFLYAFESGGSQKWKVSAEGAEVGSVAIGSDGTVYFVTDGSLYAVSPYGEKKWEYETCSGADGGVDTRVTPAVGFFTP